MNSAGTPVATGAGTALLAFDIAERRQLVAPGQPWAALADSLAADLSVLATHEPPVPERKARLTRKGGRCASDGALLEFDPFAPHAHRCPQCGVVYSRTEDHDWWVMGAHLWSAERAVHAAALHLLREDAGHRRIAADILSRAATVYLTLPNSDNVLGPTRPFFSTYLESIWLLNICHAVALLEAAGPDASTAQLLQRVRNRVVEPSAALIAEYHEGLSNRQVWNEVALLAAHRVLGDERAFAERVSRQDGFAHLVRRGLLDDGMWYEGENYHQFAQRGLWYGVEVLRAAGAPLAAQLFDRYARGFVTPFAGVLPDDTFPSRRDSQYRVSIRQWRFAEWSELGLTTRHDDTLAGVRHRLYDQRAPRGDTGRARSTADAERNVPACALTRADCSWRALLMAAPEYVDAEWAPGSVLLETQGLAVVRQREGHVYVALEGGEHHGGGHGHPDRLALTLQIDNRRALEDMGTGSYVDRTLHWYRSTLAHPAPLVDGASQRPRFTEVVAWEERAAASWVSKRAAIQEGIALTRSVVVCPDYLVDVLEWNWESPHELTLMVCGEAVVAQPLPWTPATVAGAGGLEDGFDFLRDAEVAPFAGQLMLHAAPQGAGHDHPFTLTLAAHSEGNVELMRAIAPGAPGRPAHQRHWARTRSTRGMFVSCWSWASTGAGAVVAVQLTPGAMPLARIETADGTIAEHQPAPHGWHIELLAERARSSIDLQGVRPASTATAASRKSPRAGTVVELRNGEVERFELGERHYLRTEQSWQRAGAPTARVELTRMGSQLHIVVDAYTGTPTVPPAGAENVLDNERPEVNGDGVQLYLGTSVDDPWTDGWLIVPAVPVRVVPIVAGSAPLHAAWEPTAYGWRMVLDVGMARFQGLPGCTFDLIVNERPEGRERRRGQLVLSGRQAAPGSAGEFAFLRGDRHDASHAVTLRFT